jgi:hypothetical protein
MQWWSVEYGLIGGLETDFVVECDFSSINQENNILFPKLVSFPESVSRASIQLSKLEYVITNKL